MSRVLGQNLALAFRQSTAFCERFGNRMRFLARDLRTVTRIRVTRTGLFVADVLRGPAAGWNGEHDEAETYDHQADEFEGKGVNGKGVHGNLPQ